MIGKELIGRENAGFKIIGVIGHPSQHADDAGRLFYVLGERQEIKHDQPDHVTWLYEASTDGFSNGHYIKGHADALADLKERSAK